MRKAFFFLPFLFLLACNKGSWVTQTTFRPKHPRFSVVKKPFVPNEQINSQFIYVQEKSYVSDDQNRIMYDFVGFYPDGRIIAVSLTDLELGGIIQLNTWNLLRLSATTLLTETRSSYSIFCQWMEGFTNPEKEL